MEFPITILCQTSFYHFFLKLLTTKKQLRLLQNCKANKQFDFHHIIRRHHGEFNETDH